MASINVEYLKQSYRKDGFGEEFDAVLETHINDGTPQFAIVKSEEREGLQYNCAASFRAGNTPGVYFYNGYMAMVDIPVQVDHPAGLLGPYSIPPANDGQSPENYYVNTRVLEYVLANSTGKITQSPELPATPVDTISKSDIMLQMKLLMTHKPALFIQFMEKYEPKLDFDVPPKVQEKQQALHDKHHPYQFFKPEYGIDTNTAFNMVRHGVWVYRTLKHRENQEEYGTWLKINFNKLTTNKNHEFDRWHDKAAYSPEKVLERFAMAEYTTPDPLHNQRQIKSIVQRLRNGALPMLTPVVDPGNAVMFSANPPYNTVVIYDSTMKPQRHEKYKVPSINEPAVQAQAPNADTPAITITKATGDETGHTKTETEQQPDDKKKVSDKPRRRQPADLRNKKGKGPSSGGL